MTADEITYAGGYKYANLTSPYAWYYLNSAGGSITGGAWWWSLSPHRWDGDGSHVWHVDGSDYPGHHGVSHVRISYRARPAISIKSGVLYSKGNGSPGNPYEIIYN